MKTIAEKLVEFCGGLEYPDIPPAVVEKVKDLVLDTLGICAASSAMDFGRSILGLVGSWGGAPEATLVGFKTRVPAHAAALANGFLAHGLDYDDTHTESVVHPSACLVPAAFAAAEKHRRAGRELIADLAAGLELMIRIGLPARNRFHMRGFHTTSICGTFAAAAVAGRMMGLPRERMVDALGICGSFTSGLLECLSAGTGAKRLHAGWAGMCGIMAAQLAGGGVTGPATVFEGRLGLYASFLRSEEIGLEEIFSGIGRHWEVLNVRPKLYPACHYLQTFIDCIRHLRKKHDLTPPQVSQITCRVSPGAENIICTPWASKLVPQTGYDSRFSLPFAVALGLVERQSGLDQFSESALQNPDIQAVMAKVRYEVDPSFQVKDMPALIEVRTRDGSAYTHHIPQVRGNAENPIGRGEILAKFIANCSLAEKGQGAERLAETVFNLEAERDVSTLIGSL